MSESTSKTEESAVSAEGDVLICPECGTPSGIEPRRWVRIAIHRQTPRIAALLMGLVIMVMALITIGGAWAYRPLYPGATLLPGPMTIGELRERAENGSPDTAVIDALQEWAAEQVSGPLRGFDRIEVSRAGRSASAGYFTNYGAPFQVLWTYHNVEFADGVERTGRSVMPRPPKPVRFRLTSTYWWSATHSYHLNILAIIANVFVALGVVVLVDQILKKVTTWRPKRRRISSSVGVIVPMLLAMFWVSPTHEHLVFEDHPAVAPPTGRDWNSSSISLLNIERSPRSTAGDQQICQELFSSLPDPSPVDALVQLKIEILNMNSDQKKVARGINLGAGWPIIWFGHTRYDADSFPSTRLHVEFDPLWDIMSLISITWPNAESAKHAHLTEIYPGGIVVTVICLVAPFFGTKLLVWLIAGRRYHKRRCTNSCLRCGYDLTNLISIPNPKQ